ncbi:MAG: 4-(cytidine 5'-diphospho)-2-C-methyl-D-erythritol kinase [Chitinophagaceae bacterium]|nr:4-(cytidine 5'-diphospho)-2-C-methyl-D-erythritol kinase [Chitinophagaceae bacterium]
MIVFPHCKINLGLQILSKREDGFHNIDAVFFPIPWYDVLEIICINKSSTPAIHLTQSGMAVPGDENICEKTFHLLKNDFPALPSVAMHLHKNIPVGAGLGGGSADAAFALLAINQLAGLQLSTTQLQAYAEKLGSDCSFFLQKQPCIVSGKGEICQPVSLSLPSYKIVLVNPGIHIPTAEAYAHVQLVQHEKNIREIINYPVQDWKHTLKNDFETGIFEKFPAIAEVKKEMYNQNAVYALMSGSGSTVFGIFEKNQNPHFSFPENYLLRTFDFGA